METPRPAEDVARAWTALARLYAAHPTDPVIAGSRAAAEWTLQVEPTAAVSPITTERVEATLDRVRDESHYAAMVELGIRPGDRNFARGVSSWLFWWTGLRPLPPWLRRLVAAA